MKPCNKLESVASQEFQQPQYPKWHEIDPELVGNGGLSRKPMFRGSVSLNT